jgi:hypothetical protein
VAQEAFMPTRFRNDVPLLVCVVGLLLGTSAVRAESKHVFGIHFWDWGANVDVMSHRTGWVVECNALEGGAMPNVGGRYEPAVAEGFTVLQRLDWGNTLETIMAVTEADQNTFAQRCGQWANALKNYCRVYTIGNEMEFVTGMTPAVYASGFTKVRSAIRAVQPDAKVIIGHWNDVGHVREATQMLGPDGYDGITAHVGSGVPDDMLDMLDQENARPGVGVYITEWGWVADTNSSAMSVMRSFYLEIGTSNAGRSRQVYCACWYLYPGFLGKTFSLQLATLYDNAAFEAATAIGTSFNSYSANPVIMSSLYADIGDAGGSISISWTTNVPARQQLWWTPAGTSGWQNEHYTPFDANQTTNHQLTMTGLTASTVYEVLPTSNKDDYADAGGRRYRVKPGPWTSSVTQTGSGRVAVTWITDWPADGVVEYGTSSSLGSTASSSGLATNHQLTISGLSARPYYYRVLSAENNPDPGGTRLYMRSPIRTFSVLHLVPGDMDDDCDVDQMDFGRFQACYSGSGIPQTAPECFGARLDTDEDVDPDDFTIFIRCLSGPGVCGDTSCLDP